MISLCGRAISPDFECWSMAKEGSNVRSNRPIANQGCLKNRHFAKLAYQFYMAANRDGMAQVQLFQIDCAIALKPIGVAEKLDHDNFFRSRFA